MWAKVSAETFQVAEPNSNLMSVSQICDHGYQCIFDEDHARVVASDGEVICQFDRERNVYVTKMGLRSPTPFGRQEQQPQSARHKLCP